MGVRTMLPMIKVKRRRKAVMIIGRVVRVKGGKMGRWGRL